MVKDRPFGRAPGAVSMKIVLILLSSSSYQKKYTLKNYTMYDIN